MKIKCIICSKTKGKRGCLLKNMTLICSKCCAETRNPECEGCSYYKETEKFAIEKAKKAPVHFTARIAPEIDDEIDRALAMVERGKIAAGEKIIRSLMIDNADLYSIQFAMGVIHSTKEQYDEAMAYYDKSIAIYPFFVDCWFNRGLTAQKKMDALEMVTSFRKVIEFGEVGDEVVVMAQQLLSEFESNSLKHSGLNTDDYIKGLQQFNVAFEFMQNQQWQQAIAGFKKVIKINPTAPQSFGNLALCYAHLNENDKAMEAFDTAIEIDSHYEPAIINRELLKKAMANGQTFSETQPEMRTVDYGKNYSVKDNKKVSKFYFPFFK